MNDEGKSPERMDVIEQYVDHACGHLGLASSLKEHIRDEIRGHLLEAIEVHVARGMPREEASERAIEEFGDPGEVAEGLKAVYGRHAVRLLIEKAMEWKELTMKSGWKWSFVAHLMLGVLVLAEILLIFGAACYVFPVIEMEYKTLGLELPSYWQTTLSILRTVVVWQGLLVALLVLAIGVFEWRYRGENKPMVRLAAGGVAGVVLMGLVSVVAFASTVPLVQLHFQLDSERAVAVVRRDAVEAEAAYQEILRAFAAEQPRNAAAGAHRLHSAMSDLKRSWVGTLGLAALEQESRLGSLRDLVREVENCARDLSRPESDTLTGEERKRGYERLRSAYERLSSAVEGWPKASKEPAAPADECRHDPPSGCSGHQLRVQKLDWIVSCPGAIREADWCFAERPILARRDRLDPARN
jgi:hypothetical protein